MDKTENTQFKTEQEALEQSKAYFNGNELAASVFISKYALRNEQGEVLEATPRAMHKRLAKEFARADKKRCKATGLKPLNEEEIFKKLDGFVDVIPQGSPMYAIGNPHQKSSAANCYVASSPEDSYGGILHTDQQLVQLSKRRAGVGIDISKLRPKGMPTRNAAKSTTGIVPFCERFSNSIREVGQCIAKGEKVIVKGKGLTSIEDVKRYDFVWTKEGWIQNLETVNNGKKLVFRLTTDSGYEIITSEDHVFQTFDTQGELTETRLRDFEAGDNITLCLGEGVDFPYLKLNKSDYANSNNKPANCKLPDVLCEELAYILGFSYGDGGLGYKQNEAGCIDLSVENKRPKIKEKLDALINKVFKYQITYRKGCGDLQRLSIGNKTIVQFLRQNGLLKQKSGDLIFPESIKKSNSKVQAAFLSGYFDADGYASGRKKGYCFSSISWDFLKNVQKILSSLGVAAKIHKENRESLGWSDLYSLGVVGKSAQERFVEWVAPHSVKVQESKFVAKRDCWLTPFKAASFGVKSNRYSFCPDNSQFLSKNAANQLISNGETKVNSNLLQDTIAFIEEIGEEDTFDLKLKTHNLFWCNGLYVHNSGRRGALMTTCDIRHPESVKLFTAKGKGEKVVIEGDRTLETTSEFYNPNDLDFTTMKLDAHRVTGANVSIKLTDEFLQCVKENKTFVKRWPIDCSPEDAQYTEEIDAKRAWEKIIHCAWQRAEPGILFWDNIINESPADCYADEGYKTESTNPCGEIPLSELSSCRLITVNLFSCVKNPYTEDAEFDYEKLAESTKFVQRLMDIMIELEAERVQQIIDKIVTDPESGESKSAELQMWKDIKAECVKGRRTGTGIVALGDAVAATGVRYGSDASIAMCEKIYKTVKLSAYRESVDLAKALGPFSIWDPIKERDNPFLLRIRDEDPDLYKDMQKYGRRNISLLTTAPTGSVALLAQLTPGFHGSTGGIEPNYSNVPYTRKKKINPDDKDVRVDSTDQNGDSWQHYDVYPSGIEAWMQATGETDIEKSPYHGASAEELDWKQRVKFQAVAQGHIDHSISSTINLPSDVTEAKVSEIYYSAWEMGLKGVTVYRDGCRTGVLVKKDESPSAVQLHTQSAAKRPKELEADIHIATAKGSRYVVAVGLLDGQPYEVFGGEANGFGIKQTCKGKIIKHKRGQYGLEMANIEIDDFSKHFTPQEQAIFRMASTMMRHGVPIEFVVEQMQKSTDDMFSLPSAVARVLKKYIKDGQKVSGQTCPSCGSDNLVYQESCLTCKACGWGKCS